MKIKVLESVLQFTPVSLSLTFETQEEVDTFHAIMDHSIICDFIEENTGKNYCSSIRDVLRILPTHQQVELHSLLCRKMKEFYNSSKIESD